MKLADVLVEKKIGTEDKKAECRNAIPWARVQHGARTK